MLFPTIDSAIFFSIVLVGSWLLAPKALAWKAFILLASFVFYAWWDWRFIFLLAASILVNQAGAVVVARAYSAKERACKERTGLLRPTWQSDAGTEVPADASPPVGTVGAASPSLAIAKPDSLGEGILSSLGPKRAMAGAVVANLALLGWFKYYGFFSLNFDHLLKSIGSSGSLPLLAVTLPVGISFFTFMGLSYVIDVYRRNVEPAGWLDAAVYLSFFPHLIAGPIVRGSDLLPQLRTRRNPSKVDLSKAAYLIFGGLFKKVVISSFISTAIVDPVFGSPSQHTSIEVLFAIYGYAIQIYADFSGYTDIAIGLALLLGIRFPKNFDAPYAARSLQDFWRRWNMTLSFWLRDYLYIPLGGNEKGRWGTYRNIVITMVLGGLWHGAAWTFVAWGAFHGLGQVFGHAKRSWRKSRGLPAQSEGRWAVVGQRVATFHIVCLGWVFFRATSMSNAWAMLSRLWSDPFPATAVTGLVVVAIAFSIATQYVPPRIPLLLQFRFSKMNVAAQGVILAVTLLAITTMGPPGVAPFIYYRF